jgi:hypothetical protein
MAAKTTTTARVRAPKTPVHGYALDVTEPWGLDTDLYLATARIVRRDGRALSPRELLAFAALEAPARPDQAPRSRSAARKTAPKRADARTGRAKRTGR